MAFCSFAKDAAKSLSTTVENTFFTDYLPEADGDAIKAYLYGLYLCRNNEGDFSCADMAKALCVDEDRIKDYFRYWEEYDAVTIVGENPFIVKYLPLTHYGKPRKYKSGKYDDFNKSIQTLISERMISTNEYSDYFALMEDYGITAEALLMIAQYCVDIKSPSISGKYVIATARDFASRGITTASAVEAELSDFNSSSAEAQKILTAMGLRRKADIDDYNYFSKWTNELGFASSAVCFAAKKTKSKTTQRLDAVLMELYSAKKYSQKEIEEYLFNKEKVYELAKKLTRNLSVYCEVITPVVETYVNPWLNLGFQEDSLLFVSSYCFKKRRRSLEAMNDTINRLYEQGAITLSSITSYAKRKAADDDFLRGIFLITGEERFPNEWDRKRLADWRAWGFNDELITAAATRAAGKLSPAVYMNSILGDWKQKGIFSTDKIPAAQTPTETKKLNPAVDFATARTYTKEELDKLVDDIESVDF